ncbi:MAG TPA: SHD1 domain-containing protein [Thermoguttaceae bacterium]|nr:SHD1 domain-containing protein [Thermoguttaceae bacterium]
MRILRASRWLIFIAVSSLVLFAASGATAAGPLRYAPKAKQTFVYEVEITATLPTEIETNKGTVTYHVLSAEDPLKLRFEGGLHQFSRPRPDDSAAGGPPFAPHGFFPHGPRFGFHSPMQGIGHAVNTLTMTPRGQFRSLTGESQLPYLLGNLSLLMLEPLAEADEKSWTIDTGVAVTEKNDSFGWRGPRFLPGFNQDKWNAGSESNSFAWESDQGDLSVYRKTYRLHAEGDGEKMTANGSGRWTFNRTLGMPESLDYTGTLVVEIKGVSLTIPVTVKYHRLSEEQRAKLQKEREEAAAKSKAERKSPIEGREREKFLEDLKSDTMHGQMSALMKIGRKDLRDDPELAAAIEPLTKQSNKSIARLARQALAKVSPEYAKRFKLIEQYEGLGVVRDLGEPVAADTPLPPGLIVAYRERSFWKSGKVAGTFDDGRVVIQPSFGRNTQIVSRSDLRLAPPGLEQPVAVPASPTAKNASATRSTAMNPSSDYRVWTDDSGTFTIMAKFLGVDGDAVRLERKGDGKEIRVPLDRLNEGDRQEVEKLRRPPAPENPFK